MPDVKQILTTVNETDKIIGGTVGNSQEMLRLSIRRLENKIIAAYKDLEVGSNGNLLGPRVNLKQSQKIHKRVVALFEEEYGVGARFAVKGYAAVDKAIQREFKAFDITAEFTSIDANMIRALKDQAYAEYLQFGKAAQERIAQTMYDTVVAGGSFKSLLSYTTGILTGGKDARGRSMAAYATQWANDGIMNYHQAVTMKKANDADIRSFLYYGDIIKTSRAFCIDRVGKVFSKKQINSWNDLAWSGKAGPPLTYRGGYNCRHHWHPVKQEWIPDGEIPIQDIYKEQGITIPRGTTIPVWPTTKKLSKKVVTTGAKAAVYKDPYDRWVPTSAKQAGAADWNRNMLKYGDEFAEITGVGPCGPVADNIAQVLRGMGRDARIMYCTFDDGVNVFPHYVAVELNKAGDVVKLWDPTNPFLKAGEKIMDVNPKKLPRKWFNYSDEYGEWDILDAKMTIVEESPLYAPSNVDWWKSKMLKPEIAKAPVKGMPKPKPPKPKKFVPAKTLAEGRKETQRLVDMGMDDDWPVVSVDGEDTFVTRFNHPGTPASYFSKKGAGMNPAERAKVLYGPDAVKYIGGDKAPRMEVVNVLNEHLGILQDRSVAYGVPRLKGFRFGSSNSAGASMGDGVLFVDTRNANVHWAAYGAESADKAAQKLETVVAKMKANIKAAKTKGEREALKKYLPIKEAELKAAKAGNLRFTDISDWEMPTSGNAPKGGPPITTNRPYSGRKFFQYSDQRFKYTLEHEYGHHIHQTLFVDGDRIAYNRPYLEKWLSEIQKRPGSLSPTGYGTTNQKEWFAENYAIWRLGRKELTSPVLRPLLEGLDDLEAGKINKSQLLTKLDDMLEGETL